MAKNTKNRKTTKGICLPAVEKPTKEKISLPFNGSIVKGRGFSFSFACFDHTHELFNLGDDQKPEKCVSGNWFIGLLDCLKSVGNMTFDAMRQSMHDLHPIDWTKTNASPPDDDAQREYWQFRINKSKGRIIGFMIDGVFYIVWLDPHHNLTDSNGYGKATYHHAAKSTYELQEERIQFLEKENRELSELLGNSQHINELY